MYRPISLNKINAVIVAALLAVPTIACAQDTRLEQWGKANQNFGMDNAAFRQLFAPASKPGRLPAPPSVTVEEFANQVTEVRVFLTPEANTVVGEIASTGKTRLKEIAFTLEKEAVRFSDNGEAPDKRKGDGVFTARFRMDTVAVWKTLRPEIVASLQAFSKPEKHKLRLGAPRRSVWNLTLGR